MDFVFKIWAFLGFLAFIRVLGISSKLNRRERWGNDESQMRSSLRDDMKAVMTQYIGKEIVLDFYEDEEDIDMLDTSKHNKFTLMDVDEKWALIHIEKPKKSVEKLIRLSSIKGFSLKECKSE